MACGCDSSTGVFGVASSDGLSARAGTTGRAVRFASRWQHNPGLAFGSTVSSPAVATPSLQWGDRAGIQVQCAGLGNGRRSHCDGLLTFADKLGQVFHAGALWPRLAKRREGA